MPPRRRVRVSIPDTAGLDRDGEKVGNRRPATDDPWDDGAVFKTWTQSFANPGDSPDPHVVRWVDGPDYWFRAEVADVDFDAHFRLGVSDEGQLVVTGLLLGSPGGTQPITTSNLHKLPIGAIYEAISRLDDVTSAVAEKARKFRGEIPARGGQRTPDKQFAQAAEIYKQCLVERPNDPIKCVAEKLGVSSATASRRVQRARDLGLLRGEQPTPESDKAQRDLLIERLSTTTDENEKTGLQVEIWNIEERLNIPMGDRSGIPF
jgi:hypothetical protein